MRLRDIAMGKWPGILVALGFPADLLSGKHQSCPHCGGRDRFRFDDKAGRGTFFCSQCGPGDGVELVMRVKGLDFKEAAEEIERAAGFVKAEKLKPAKSDEDKVKALRRMWLQSRPVVDGDPVSLYLKRRGLPLPGAPVLRYLSDCYYREGDVVGKYPAMLALVTGPDGAGVTIHRTYLTLEGNKANVGKAKKLMPGMPLLSASVRLFPAGVCLGIAEGLETALGAANRFSIPVWSAISAAGLEAWMPPAGVERVVVCGDNDVSMVGQRAAYALASKLQSKGFAVEVRIPDQVGKDWADL